MRIIKHIAKEYNFLWILYFFYITFAQLAVVYRVSKGPQLSFYNIYDVILAALYIFSIFVFVFRKKVFTTVIWQIIFLIIVFDLLFSFWRILFGDNPTNYQFNCSQIPALCSYTIFSSFLGIVITGLPIYYALAKLAFPKFTLPFSLVLYPHLTIKYNEAPTRFWAIPLLGGFIKVIILIPYFIAQVAIGFCALIFQFINAFHVLFTGKIWKPAYDFTFWAISMQIRAYAYLLGLTNRYPNYGKKGTDQLISLEYTMPTKSNRIYAIPLVGWFIRYLFIVPFTFYTVYLTYGALLGTAIGSFAVLFTGKYPKSVYELANDSIRLNASASLFFSGMSDKYPSFEVSLNYPVKKALLIGFILLLAVITTKSTQALRNYTPQSSSGSYEQLYKNAYMRSCVNGDSKMSLYCSCTYTYLRKRYTTDQISQIGTAYNTTNQVPQPMQTAAYACSSALR